MSVLRDRRFPVVALVFVVAFVVRWVTLPGLSGDDHVALWTAGSFLNGELPVRDFADLGDPLYRAISALVQLIVGYRVVGEVLLGVALAAFGVALSFHLAWQASRSVLVAAVVTALALLVITATKLYSYPKIFVYPLGLWLSWRYIDRPTLVRALVLAFGTVVAFGYRHDHGAYVGLGSVAAVLAAHWRDGARPVLLGLSRLGLAGSLLLAPYLVFVQAHESLVDYFRDRIGIAAQLDAADRQDVSFTIDAGAPRGWVRISPPSPVRLALAWAPAVTPSMQVQLERRYTLVRAAAATTGWQPYIVEDFSEGNLAALMSDRRVARVDGIVGSFRRAYRAIQPTAYGAVVVIDWVDSLPEYARAQLERRYRLANGRMSSSKDSSWTYDIVDVSEPNLAALATERRVQQLTGIELVRKPIVVSLREPPPAGPKVFIAWAVNVPSSARAHLERQYHLMNGRPDSGDRTGRIWAYEIVDASEGNVTALATSPRVTYKDGIIDGHEPGTYRVRERPPYEARISVVWDRQVTEEERALLERRYRLSRPHPVHGMTEYTLVDARTATLRALVSDPRIVQTSGIDRERYRPEKESWLAALRRDVPILRLVIAPRIVHGANAGIWLYYLSLALPPLVLLALLLRRWRRPPDCGMALETQKMFSAAVMVTIAHIALFRRLGYFADHVGTAAVFGAWFIGLARHPRSTFARRLGITVAAVTLAVSVFATFGYADVGTLSERSHISGGLRAAWDAQVRQFRDWAISPPIDYYAPREAIGDRALLRYLYECTRPEDRIWVTSDAYTIPYYVERRVVDHIFWSWGFHSSPEHQRRTIATVESHPVPLIIGVGGDRPLQPFEKYPVLYDYVSRRYREYEAILQDHYDRDGVVIWLLVDSRRAKTGMYAKLGLPCFT